MARYAGQIVAPAEGISLQSRFLFALLDQQITFYAIVVLFRPFLGSVVIKAKKSK